MNANADSMQRDRTDLEASGLFDPAWYLETYPDVAQLGMDPLEHFLWLGARLNRSPGPTFDAAAYRADYADVARADYNPVLHYIRYGRPEGRKARAPGLTIPPLAESAGASAPFRRLTGHRARRPGHPTVLLVAHIVGHQLYGSERSLLDMLDGLAAMDANVIVAVPSTRNKAYIELLRARACAVSVLSYGWWRAGTAPDETVIATFARVITEERIDIVHANTIMLREPLIAARRLGLPAVVQARELIRHDAKLLELIGLSADEIIAALWENCDVMIANSRATAACFDTETRRSAVVYNTADMTALQALPPPPAEAPLRVGMVSSNVPKKGLADFAEVARLVAAELPDAEFLLIGPQHEHTEAIEARIADGSLPRSLRVAGYRDTPAEAMAELDLVLSLSHFQESFGRTVLEAMAAGRPVIVYDHGAPPELVVSSKTGQVVPFGDIQAVADQVLAYGRDRKRLLVDGLRAADHAETTFGRTAYNAAMAAAYAPLLQELARDAHRPEQMVLRARDLPVKIPRDTLKVAYFCWHFPVPSETFVLNELRILKAQGIDVTVFCRDSPYPDFTPDFDITWEQVHDADHLARRLTETGRDVVHGHFVYPTVTEMVWPAARIANIPFTCIAHAQDIFRYRNAVANRIDEISADPLCRQIFTLSRFHRQYLVDRGVRPEKVTINSNCIDPELFSGGKIPDRPARRTRSVAAVSRFADKKGLEVLVRAGKLLEDDGITINIHGYGPLEDLYRQIIAEQEITNVTIHGPVEGRAALLEVFRTHDLFAVPSVRALDGDMDGIPTTLMEAMAAGLPVLTTPVAGIPDLVRDGITGMLSEDATPEALAAKIREFYALPEIAVQVMIEDAEALLRRNHNGPDLVNTLLRFWAGETIDLMIVSWNNLAQTREVIRRLYEYTDLPFHLIVCDNGSDPPALAHLLSVYAARTNFTLILNRENAFVGPGTNKCIAQGDSDYMIYVCGKEGMTTRHGWEKSFVTYMDAHPRVGQAGTLCYSPSYLFGRDYPEGVALFPDFRNPGFAADNPDRPFSHVQGGFFVIRRATYDEIGGFSDAVPHSYTDVEFSYYVESCGWELGTVPGLMALFNKTRPGLEARVDEHHGALHPPNLDDLPWLDRIARREVRHCNMCGHQAPAFEGGDAEARCAGCGSDRRARSLHRVLAETILLYRRLPGLGVNLPAPLQGFWSDQFQGPMLPLEAFTDPLSRGQTLPNRAGALQLACLNDVLDDVALRGAALAETARLLAPGATLFVAGATPLDTLEAEITAAGFTPAGRKRPCSAVLRFDWIEIGLYTRAGDTQ
ncbi:glycosyl transferase group 1 domain protein (plasmid) [Dinoroseobacter shibae DFL 12 = DSM 16493]|jgi:glycosyltransferase involved in cell wall biosynthesis|uniref:Glycosyl transferase group 1 domain protein n=1 Tax=Dinoroseobacter shibae (strain DSM 16493 / NCIMB 14021 / DFL 12) TaxID=398580 RepID=A8LTM7_DINSH|nr:glycosyltransferase [Dinoroseobacter shibae]ABV95594.1 glycosyl transferase group 1 domain protein [Dinoroseobacter shibae DFL 12 = DSM 16493]URF48935.1 glycosyltransferase [Dinoroseobacter shibae]URF53247.1 glycosyltransferase [Dinoroseobacter shibae]